MHDLFMQRCIELAQKGEGNVAPNPLVGCVIVHNEKIIGEGYHQLFGKPHAEVNAINSVKDKSLLRNSSLYVTLEPCSHHGKTPPCTDLILKHKIPRVFIGTYDPFEKVNGSGAAILKKNGVKVTVGILENDCRMVNRRFHVFHKRKRPYIILKWAQSKDGFIATIPKNGKVKNSRISNDYSRMLVHKWRSTESSIMVGTNTAITDNPELTTRYWIGSDPVRVVVDRSLKLPSSLHLFDKKVYTIVFTERRKESADNLLFAKIDFNNFPESVLAFLHKNNFQSLFIEGGSMLLKTFIDTCLWDEARVLTSGKLLGKGIVAPHIPAQIETQTKIDDDTLNIYYN